MSVTPPLAQRRVRSAEIAAADAAEMSNAIEEMYNDRLDVLVVRGAFDRRPLTAAAERLDRNDTDPGWARPNQQMPVEDIQLLGTDTPATPTFRDPRGASLETYLESAARHKATAAHIFDERFDPIQEITHALSLFAGGRPVATATAGDGRPFVPFTVRRLVDGKQIGLHHDYHYTLPLYSELAPRLDTTTLVSYVATLQRPEAGGDLYVYGVTPDTPNPPKLPNGFSWDLAAVERDFDSARFTVDAGDLFLLASGRCLHRVDRIAGPRARVTMGGFLALTQGRDRVLYWS
jgi:hypothetical protein